MIYHLTRQQLHETNVARAEKNVASLTVALNDVIKKGRRHKRTNKNLLRKQTNHQFLKPENGRIADRIEQQTTTQHPLETNQSLLFRLQTAFTIAQPEKILSTTTRPTLFRPKHISHDDIGIDPFFQSHLTKSVCHLLQK